MPRDYYDVLGVSRTASPDEIRKAHRKLARKLHPDVNKAPDAAAKFAEAQEAYDVLSDTEKRKRYDQFGHAGVGGATGGASGSDPFGGQNPFRGGPFSGTGGQQRGRPNTWSSGDGGGWSDVDPETFDTVFGDLFGSRRGGRGQRPGARSAAAPSVGEDLEHTLTIPFAVAALGGSESVRLTLGDGSTQSIDVKIPIGIRPGSKLRIKGKGKGGSHGGPPGDLILIINVGDHPWFRRDGLDLLLDVPITVAEAALGTILEVPLLKGTVKLKVPPGTSSGAKLRAKGKGLIDAKGEAGDFYAVIRIVAPEAITADEKKLFEALQERLPNPRAATLWAEDVGLG
ncbi:MAG: DnaJ domain-containing protein [Phycisphaerae bacterium]|nr:DnaJ domain-containing protein [Phycisphaerae bacterium]